MSKKEGRPPVDTPSSWTPDASFKALAQRVRDLREGEKRGGRIEDRTEFILSLFLKDESGTNVLERYEAEGAPVALWPDTDGLRLAFGLNGAEGIHSHIPYARIPEEVAAAIQESALFANENAAIDFGIRAAEARADEEYVADLRAVQEEALGREMPGAGSLVERIEKNPEAVATAYMKKGARLPESLGRLLLEQGKTTSIMALMRTASELNGGYRGQDGDEFYVALHPEAWQRLHASSETARFSRSVYKSRAEKVYADTGTVEAAKILELILEQHDYASLTALGIETVRGSYGSLEFVAFFSGSHYERILIDPAKHIRNPKAAEHYASIPSVPQSDFEAFEGFLLPYVEFSALERALSALGTNPKDAAAREHMEEHIRGMLSLLASEMEPLIYEPFLSAGKKLLSALESGLLNEEVVAAFAQEVRKMHERYGERFAGTPIPSLLESFLKVPERSTIPFDSAYIESIENPQQREKVAAYLETLPVKNPPVTVVRSGTDTGIPFALEGKALRALKITARPTLVLIMGAKSENIEDQAYLERIADAVISAGKEANANVFMQGTMSGKIAETIVRKYWEYRAALPEGAEPFRLIAIEPGRSVYAGALGYPEAELSSAHPLLPIDTILTPYAAGWSPEQTVHSYLPHVVWRQSVIRHAAAGNPAATLVINGGGWAIPEAVESMRDGFVQIALPESGRFASLLGHLRESYSSWFLGGAPAALRELESFIQSRPEGERAQLQNDLPLMLERGLEELLSLIHSEDVLRTTDEVGLSKALAEALQKAG